MNISTVSRRNFLTSATVFALASASSLLLPRVSGIARAEEPTVQETQDWIIGKVNEIAGWRQSRRNQGGTIYSVILNFDNCQIQKGILTFSSLYLVGDNDRTTTKYSAPLMLLSKSVTVEKRVDDEKYETILSGDRVRYLVSVSASNEKKVIAVTAETHIDGQTAKQDSLDSQFYVAFKDEEMANRFAKAMSHLIELSGGKKEAF